MRILVDVERLLDGTEAGPAHAMQPFSTLSQVE
jgi:hypothetical protein